MPSKAENEYRTYFAIASIIVIFSWLLNHAMTSLDLPDGTKDVETLDLVVRFSAAIPDLNLLLQLNPPPTTATLKQRIRTHLPSDLAQRRIRLIQSGKALADDGILPVALKRPSSHVPSRVSTPLSTERQNDKGKSPIRDPPSTTKVYIHCSIGDVVLSPADILAEGQLALNAKPSGNAIEAIESAIPTPRGFDRLLSAGFTAQEVANLRLQFLNIQAHTHTPDDMPSPNTVRSMEDRWLDNSSSPEGTTVTYDDEGTVGQLDDIIWGSVVGFFWPLGCMLWVSREEGIWTRRRKMAVVVGMLVNLGLGCVRWMR